MALPRCPACGSAIFPSAREAGDASPLCEDCQTKAASTPAAKEELIEPSGPFLLPGGALPPHEVMNHLVPPPLPERTEDVEVMAPSGPLDLPAGPRVVMADAPDGDQDGGDEEVVVEPSGPFVVPSSPPPVSLEASEGGRVDPYLHGGAAAVRGGVVHGVHRPRPAPADAMPSIVVDPGIDGGPTPTVGERPEVSWTPLAIAFVAGMLAGAALVLAILRI